MIKKMKVWRLGFLILFCSMIFQTVIPAGAEKEIIVEDMTKEIPDSWSDEGEVLYENADSGEVYDTAADPEGMILEVQEIQDKKAELSEDAEKSSEKSAEIVLYLEDDVQEEEQETKEKAEEIAEEEQNVLIEKGTGENMDKDYEISSDGYVGYRREENESGVRTEYYVYANPDTEDMLGNPDFAFLENPELMFPEGAASMANGDYRQFTSVERAGAEMRQKLKERVEIFDIGFQMDKDDYYNELPDDIFAEAIKHTGVPTEGDYLKQAWRKNYTKIQSSVNNGVWSGVIQCRIKYYTTAEQEAAVDQKVAEIMNHLNLSGKSEYEKIKTIYDYICFNVRYDEEKEGRENHLNHSAYAALVNGSAVCNGYAQSFYRMAMEAGLSARYVGGKTSKDATVKHAWNIVKLGDVYYNLDATWDWDKSDPENKNYELFLERGYKWFLKCPENFTSHYRDEIYSTNRFNYQYPMADKDYDVSEEMPEEHSQRGTCGEQLTWELDGQGVLTIQGSGVMMDYSDENPSPWEVKNIKKVILMEGITGIGANAFCYSTNMTEAVLPQSLETIGDYAFAWCNSLKEIKFPQGLKKTGEYSFYKCSELTELEFPGTINSIGTRAFGDVVELRKVTMKNGVKGLGEFVFQGCVNLKEVSFPLSAVDANESIFNDCQSLEELTVTGSGKIPEYTKDKKAPWNRISLKKIMIGNGITETGGYAFYDMDGLEEVSFSDSVTKIGKEAFADSDSLTKVKLPSGINEISEKLFYACKGLKTIVIPEKVTKIGVNAFSGCDSLSQIAIPSKVEELGAYCFYSCDSLVKVMIPGNVKNVSSNAFAFCKALTTLTVSNGVETLSDFAFGGCEKLQSVSVPMNIQAEKNNIFSQCPFLTQITITGKGAMPSYKEKAKPWSAVSVKKVILQDGITNIGEEAFKSCGSLTEIVIPESVKQMDSYAFALCKALKTIKIHDGVKTLSDFVFYECDSLQSVTIPASVKIIGSNAFSKCDNLRSAEFPVNVEVADNSIFGNCPLLTQITITGTGAMPSYKEKAKPWSAVSVKKVILQDGITKVGDYVFNNCDNLDQVVIPASVETIGECSFYSCDGLVKVTVPGNVKNVSSHAFAFCKALTTLTVSSGVETLSLKAFYGCKELQNVSVPASVKTIESGVFSGCEKLKLSVIYGSVAEKYAKDNNIPFNSNACDAPEMKTAKNEKAGIKTTWKKVSGADGYRVFRKSGSSWKRTADVKGGNTVTYTDKTVKSGTKYFYKVRTLKNGKIAGDQSINSVSSVYLSAPALKNVSGKVGKKAVVKWKKVGKGDGYEFQFRKGKITKKVEVKNAGTVQQTVKLQQAGTYEVSIRSYKKSGGNTWYSVWSTAKKVTVKK